MTTSLPPAPQFSPVPSVPSPAAGIPGAGAPGDSTSQTGTSGANYMVGTSRDNSVTALGGNATILSGDGNDTANAGAGNDFVDAGNGEIFLGCPINILTMDETVELARGSMRDRTRLQHVALNVAKLVNMPSDPTLAADVANSDVVEHRRHGHRLGRAPLGLPVTTAWPASISWRGCSRCARGSGFRPYLPWRDPEVLQRAVAHAAGAPSGAPLCRFQGRLLQARPGGRCRPRNPRQRRRLPLHRHADPAQGTVSRRPPRRARTCPSSWGSAEPSTCCPAVCQRAPLAVCRRSGSSGLTASTRSRAACGGATPGPTRCLPRILAQAFVRHRLRRPPPRRWPHTPPRSTGARG